MFSGMCIDVILHCPTSLHSHPNPPQALAQHLWILGRAPTCFSDFSTQEAHPLLSWPSGSRSNGQHLPSWCLSSHIPVCGPQLCLHMQPLKLLWPLPAHQCHPKFKTIQIRCEIQYNDMVISFYHRKAQIESVLLHVKPSLFLKPYESTKNAMSLGSSST